MLKICFYPNALNEQTIKYSLGQNIVAFSQTSDTIIWFAHTTDSTADSIHFWCASHDAGVWINFSNADLDWSMIFSVDDTVASRAANFFN